MDVGKLKKCKLTPKQDKHAQPNTSNPTKVKEGGALRLDLDSTTPNENHNSNSPENPTPDPRVDITISPIPTTPKKLPTPIIVSLENVFSKQITRIYLTYKARALAALLTIHAA